MAPNQTRQTHESFGKNSFTSQRVFFSRNILKYQEVMPVILVGCCKTKCLVFLEGLHFHNKWVHSSTPLLSALQSLMKTLGWLRSCCRARNLSNSNSAASGGSQNWGAADIKDLGGCVSRSGSVIQTCRSSSFVFVSWGYLYIIKQEHSVPVAALLFWKSSLLNFEFLNLQKRTRNSNPISLLQFWKPVLWAMLVLGTVFCCYKSGLYLPSHTDLLRKFWWKANSLNFFVLSVIDRHN